MNDMADGGHGLLEHEYLVFLAELSRQHQYLLTHRRPFPSCREEPPRAAGLMLRFWPLSSIDDLQCAGTTQGSRGGDARDVSR